MIFTKTSGHNKNILNRLIIITGYLKRLKRSNLGSALGSIITLLDNLLVIALITFDIKTL